jgi:hypothetical protein
VVFFVNGEGKLKKKYCKERETEEKNNIINKKKKGRNEKKRRVETQLSEKIHRHHNAVWNF